MNKIFLAILSGLILGLSWPSIGNSILLFFGFIPLFILEDIISFSMCACIVVLTIQKHILLDNFQIPYFTVDSVWGLFQPGII